MSNDETPTPEETRQLLGVEDNGEGGHVVDLSQYQSESDEQEQYEDPRKVAFQATLGGEYEVAALPSIITLADGKEFHCPDLRSWGYCALGVWAFGHYEDEDAEEVEHVMVFPIEKVENVELQFDAFERIVELHAEVLIENGVGPSD